MNTDPGALKAREVEDARLLLDYAVTSGKAVEERVVRAIAGAETLLAGEGPPPPERWAAFAEAYGEVARAVSPVTAATLRATSDEYGRKATFIAPRPRSEAKLWSRKLWLWTTAFALVILFVENYAALLREFFARDEYTDDAGLRLHMIGMVLQTIVPFTYGGLGAAAYLLRSAHGYLHTRSFDPNHIPEYYSRMLLGVIAGGAIQLFITQVADDSGVVRISAAALAFMAGYNSDLLFSTIERVSEAILPKVGLGSVRRAEPAAITGMSVQTLLQQLDQAQSEEAKEAIRGLLGKIRERL